MSDILSRIPEGYTPGPWKRQPVHTAYRIWGGPRGSTLAEVWATAAHKADPNSALIALAPELADAVRSLTAERDALRELRDYYRDAIEAATGKPWWETEMTFTPTDTEAEK